MRILLPIAALAAALSGTGRAAADAPAAGFGHRPPAMHRSFGPRYAPPPRRYGYGYGAPRHRRYGYRVVAAEPDLGPVPPFFRGMGDAAASLGGGPVGLTLYREAYIGRGLFYNTPPTLDRPGPILGGRY